MNPCFALRKASLISCIALSAVLALGAAVPAGAQSPSQSDIEKHKTTPGGKYEPSLDVLKEGELEAPGAKEGVPSLSQE